MDKLNNGETITRLLQGLILAVKGEVVYSTSLVMPKRTHQPKTRHRARVHGFRARMATKAGRLVLKARRLKKRAKLSI